MLTCATWRTPFVDNIVDYAVVIRIFHCGSNCVCLMLPGWRMLQVERWMEKVVLDPKPCLRFNWSGGSANLNFLGSNKSINPDDGVAGRFAHRPKCNAIQHSSLSSLRKWRRVFCRWWEEFGMGRHREISGVVNQAEVTELVDHKRADEMDDTSLIFLIPARPPLFYFSPYIF
ncbi:hypothetical protein TNCV_4248641 [Trichonephila clavipes]|nr:hypothetical protein TNCV_4248641 [Trichonephila clavipes]